MKALASDFDGTLHFNDEEGFGYFKQEDMKAIRKFRENGSLFGLCTGRPLYGFEGDMDEGPILDFLIASSGGVITKTDHNTYVTIHEEPILLDDVIELQNVCDGKGVLYVHADGHVYTFFSKRPGIYQHQVVLDDPHKLEGKSITAISVWTVSLEMAEQLTNEVNQKFKDRLAAYQNVNWLDVVAPNASKGNGAIVLKKDMNIDLIAGIGDSFNDIPMLEKVDVAFSFNRSDERVKEKADYLVDSISEAIEILEKL